MVVVIESTQLEIRDQRRQRSEIQVDEEGGETAGIKSECRSA